MKVTHRIGIGYDVHRIETGRKLVLGGVHIPSDFGLEGHSDADVLTHAIADALLGAAGQPDIGHFFPPDDAETRGIDSQKILEAASAKVKEAGYEISNIDAVLIAEAPRIGPYTEAMKARLSETLGVSPGAIGIKATTNEGLGWIGRGEGMAAQAVTLLTRES